MRSRWPRWFAASINKHFDARKGTVPLFIEGQHAHKNNEPEWVELRVDGPYLTEVSHHYWHIFYEVNVLVSATINDVDMYNEEDVIGQVLTMFTQAIQISKYGTDAIIDDGSVIGCLTRMDDIKKRRRTQVSRFGQIKPEVKLKQTVVEGHYEMFLASTD